MLSLNLSNSSLPNDPDVATALHRISEWTSANTWADYIEPGRLTIDLAGVRPSSIVMALVWLVEHGALLVRYRPISPYTHQVVSFDFDEPVPSGQQVRDSLNHVFAADEAEFVQVYVEPK
jgi:hypothetical protein